MANPEDAHLIVKFYEKAVLNKRKSAAEKRPVYDSVDYIELRHAGDKSYNHHARASEVHRHIPGAMPGAPREPQTYIDRFPEEYEAYKKKLAIAVSGTPIEELSSLTAGQRAELKAVNILTVEHLANQASAAHLGMNGDQMIEDAKAYLARAEDAQHDEALKAKIAELEAQVAAMTQGQSQNPAQGGTDPGGSPPPPPTNKGGDAVVEEEGPFKGMSSPDLRAYIKDQTGEGVKGSPKLSTLLESAKEIAAKLAEA